MEKEERILARTYIYIYICLLIGYVHVIAIYLIACQLCSCYYIYGCILESCGVYLLPTNGVLIQLWTILAEKLYLAKSDPFI